MWRFNTTGVINISAFFTMLGVGMMMPRLPLRLMALSGSPSNLGLLAAFFALTFLACQIPMGRLADTFGFRGFMAAGYFLCAGTGLIFYFSSSDWHIYLGRMLQGMGEVPVWALAPALLSIRHPGRKGHYLGLYNACIHSGLACGSLISMTGWMPGEGAFLFFSGTAGLSGLLTAGFIHSPREKNGREYDPGPAGIRPESLSHALGILLGSAANRTIMAGIVLYGAGYGIFISIIPGFLASVRGCGAQGISTGYTLFYLAVGLAQLLAGRLSDRSPETGDNWQKPVMVLSLLASGTGMAGLGLVPMPYLLGFLAIGAFGLGGFCVSAMALLNGAVPHALKGTASGAFYAAWGAGYFFIPPAFGAAGTPENWGIGLILVGGLFMIEAIGCLIGIPAARQAPFRM